MAKAKAFIKTLEEVAEPLREYYVEDKEAGGFVLDEDDKDFKKQLDEFRTNNRKLHNEKKQLEERIVKFKDIDLDKYTEAQEALAKLKVLEEKKLIEEGDMEKVIQNRIAGMQADYDKQLKLKDKSLSELSSTQQQLSSRLSSMLIDTEISSRVSKVGAVRAGAMTDILNRARSVFEADPANGQLKTRDGFFNKKGDVMSPDDFAADLLETSPYLFEPSRGGGANGGSRGDGDGKKGKVISKNPVDFGKNLEAIASGAATVEE